MQITLSPWQISVAKDKHRFRVIDAGRRSGKSVLARGIVLQWATTKPGRYWMVSPTYKQSKMIHWHDFRSEIPPEWIAKKNEVELSIQLKNGSIIELKGAENPDALRGSKLMGLVVDEVASVRNWRWLWQEALRPTLTDYSAPALFISTPKGFNHFYDMFQMGQGTDDQYKSWQFTSYDNPFVPREEIDQAKKELSADVFAQEYMAQFTRFTGLIYKEFDPDIHVSHFDHVYNQHGDYYFGLDFAVRGWTATVIGCIKTDGHIYILDEYKEESKTAQEHAEAIKARLKLYGQFEKYVGYADPAGFMKNQQKGDMIWAIADEYTGAGFPLVPANNEVSAGINYVRQLFRDNKIHIHVRCEKLIDELLQYQWKEQRESQQMMRNAPEEPRKIHDHLVDALRYMLFSKPSAAEEPVKKINLPIKFELKMDEPSPDNNTITPVEFESLY